MRRTLAGTRRAVLYDPAVEADIRARKPPVDGIREVLHARFVAHAYPRHTHDTWTLFVVDDGAVRYDLDRHARSARPSEVSVLPPHVVHDGRPGTEAGYRKRVIYLQAAVLGHERIGAAVDGSSWRDARLRLRLDQLFDTLERVDDALEAETRFAFLTERLAALLDRRRWARPERGFSTSDQGMGRLAEALRAILDEHLFQ